MSTAPPPGENRLARETSPYLLQHQDNPVHWWAWGPEALAEAKRTNKPILLSVGYAACHWCHVMAHESFEDEPPPRVMNELFVNIKVDREERPDIDAIYMRALHSLGEQGGWPLTMFLDSEARPFWGGTYFPPEPRFGRPSFTHVLPRSPASTARSPTRSATTPACWCNALNEREHERRRSPTSSDAALADLTTRMVSAVDMRRGGLSGAPKFPQWSFFWLLWRGAIRYGDETAQRAVDVTLTNICQGGIYDHLGGGFARYSVDERWLVPHFEKMLYDNALLIDLLCEAYRETGNELYARRIEETVAWLQREMIAEGGGFAASLDADSEGEEGKFYVWTKAEIVEVLGEADAAAVLRGLRRQRRRQLGRPRHPQSPAHARARLGRRGDGARRHARQAARAPRRPHPSRLGRQGAGRLERPDDRRARPRRARVRAARLARRGEDGLRVRRRAHGEGRPPDPLLSRRPGQGAGHRQRLRQHDLGRAAALRGHQRAGLSRCRRALGRRARRHYWVADGGGYAFTADDTPDVIVRMRGAHDDATPNANAMMISNLVALHLLTGKPAYLDRAQAIPQAFAADLGRNTLGHCGVLAGYFDLMAPQHIVVIDPAPEAGRAGRLPLARAMFDLSLPGAVQQVVRARTAPWPAPPWRARRQSTASPPPTPASARNARCRSPRQSALELLHASGP